MIVGLAMGATVAIGQAVGAQDRERAALNIGNTITLFSAVAIGATILLLLLVRPIVSVMFTPAAAVAGTVQYLTVCFLGIPFITAYNIISSIFRGLGDSRTPMYFIAVACLTNIALDYLFIGTLALGPRGAALATVISQSVSVGVALVIMRRQKSGLPLRSACLRPQAAMMRPILRIGLPIALQDGFVEIAFLLITVIANQRGLCDAAAVGIVEKIICFVFLVPSAMLATVSAIAAQNIGARQPQRAVLTLRYAILLCVGFGLTVGVAVQFVAEPLVALFDPDPAVVEAGGQYLRSYIWDCLFAGIHFSFSGYFCACGRSGISFLHNVLSITLVRIPGAYWMSHLFPATLFPMGLAAGAGSLLSVVICCIAFFWLQRREASLNGGKINERA